MQGLVSKQTLLASAAAGVLALCSSSAAFGQTASAPPPATGSSGVSEGASSTAVPADNAAVASTAGDAGAAGSVSDIVVTGTRLSSNGFEAPTPVSVITQAQIQQAAPATIADYVNQLPALQGGETPRTPRGNLAAGNAGANFLSLRNLGAPRTLVLLNGRRVTPTTVTGATDVNLLPSALVTRVDVVTGGASAAWGSDAVAGVVNFVLDTKFTGVRGKVQSGVTTEGDGRTLDSDLSVGTGFADDRGHIILSGRYTKSQAAFFSKRDWFKAYKIFPNPNARTPGQPARLVEPWSSLLVTDNGLIASGPLRGTFFNDAGGVAGTNFTFPPIVSGIYGAGSESVYRTLADQSRYGQANVPVEQGSVYGRASFDLTDAVTAFAEGSWGKTKSITPIANYFRTGNTLIQRDNFFLPQSVRDAMTAAGVTTVPLSISNSKLGVLQSSVDRENIRGLGGIEGKFGGNWKYSVSYQYGETKVKIRSPQNPRPARYATAVDAVADPRNPGQAICRSTLTNPGDGCIPINPFGSAPLSSSQLGYVLGNSMQDLTYRQTVATANISGDLLDLPAGPLSIAAGGEYRTERAVATSDDISQANGYFAGNYKPFRGRYNVKEAFAEIGIPVFKDQRFAQALDLNLAARLTDYSTSGNVVTWKAGFTYRPVEDIEFRATRSRDIRAPNLNDLFQTGTVGTFNVIDPFNNGASVQFLQTTRGNPALNPEKADTLTAGVVLRPSFLPGFGMSVDFYNIKIKKAIAINSSQFVVNQCAAGDAVSCSQITRNASNIITAITLLPFNALSEVARGIDIEASYRSNLGPGTMELRTLVNYTDRLAIISAANTIERAGEVGNNVGAAEGVPRWRALATATYTLDPVTLQLKGRFIAASKQDRQWTSADVNRNKVPAIFYLDGYVGFKVKGMGADGEFFLAADNLLNTAPPVVTPQDNSNLLASGTNVFLYDILGTTVRAGFRFKF